MIAPVFAASIAILASAISATTTTTCTSTSTMVSQAQPTGTAGAIASTAATGIAASQTNNGTEAFVSNTNSTAVNGGQAVANAQPNLFVKLNIPNVSGASFVKFQGASSLLFTTNDRKYIFSHDHVYAYNDVNTLFSNNPKPPVKLTGSIKWPNEVNSVPPSAFGTEGVLIPGGSLRFTKSDGGVWFAPYNFGFSRMKKLVDTDNHIYSRAVVYDVDKDGHPDILTCRVRKSRFGNAPRGELVWLKPENRDNPTGEWDTKKISGGCDVHFRVFDFDGDGREEIISAQMYGGALTLIQSTHPANRFDDAKFLTFTTIDAALGKPFDIQITDLNGDGRPNLLVSTRSESGNGAVYAYEVPTSLTTMQWTRHTLATPFPVIAKGKNMASPGAAQAFFPTTAVTSAIKPSIVISGDAATAAYILTPSNPTNPNDWNYVATIAHTCKGTVGDIAVADANKDGRAELYIPCYDEGALYVYSF